MVVDVVDSRLVRGSTALTQWPAARGTRRQTSVASLVS